MPFRKKRRSKSYTLREKEILRKHRHSGFWPGVPRRLAGLVGE